MIMKYGLEMRLPEGKRPGFYAQIVKGIAERTVLYDRHKELLIFNREEDLPAVSEFLSRYQIEADVCRLLSAPADAVSGTDRFEDFAVVSREGNVYFDAAYVSAFRLTEQRPEAEAAPALMQLKEHLIADVRESDRIWRVIESQLAELADKLAAAYHCGIEWFDPKRL